MQVPLKSMEKLKTILCMILGDLFHNIVFEAIVYLLREECILEGIDLTRSRNGHILMPKISELRL